MNIGLYIHIPFCRQKCLYCDFTSYAGIEHLTNNYVAALCRELASTGGLFADAVIDTVYLGGGTPTLLPIELLGQILHYVHISFKVAGDAETSIEANPGTVTMAKLQTLRDMGVNRISFGVQSFCNRILKRIGRIHCAEQAEEAIVMAGKAGFDNINVDLMYGLPTQSPDDFYQSIARAAALNVRHISAYGLKIEEGTPFAQLCAKGILDLPDEDKEAVMYDMMVTQLPEKGFERYEISNFACFGYQCKHNMKYWRYQPYLGAGLAAHSFIAGERWANTADIKEYLHAVNQQSIVTFREKPDISVQMAEYVFLALRTVEGVNFHDFVRQFSQPFEKIYAKTVAGLAAKGLIIQDASGIRLSQLGMKYGNAVFSAFLPD